MSQDIYSKNFGTGSQPFFWGHGWGQSHVALMPLAESLQNIGEHWVFDFHGFGQTPPPTENWSTEEYADAFADYIKSKTDQPVISVGHSFGCRVGIQLAAKYPELVKNLILIAGAGLPRKRPLWQKIYFWLRIRAFKILKALAPNEAFKEKLYKKFGSSDYQSAGVLRQLFVKVVNEDLSDTAAKIQCPTLLIYGEKDTETPPEIGQRLSKIIPNSKLIVMNGHDHYSILSSAQHQVVKRISEFIEK